MSKPRTGGHTCSARGCKNNQSNCGLSFFRYPKDVERAKMWVVECAREDLLENSENLYRSYRVCGAHFEEHMFLNDLQNRLQPHAIPRIFLDQEGSSRQNEHDYSIPSSSSSLSAVPEEFVPEMTSAPELPSTSVVSTFFSPSSTQTSLTLTSRTPRKEKLRHNIKQLHNENARLKAKLAGLEERQSNIDDITLEQYQQLTRKFFASRKDLAMYKCHKYSESQKDEDILMNLRIIVFLFISWGPNYTRTV